MGLIVRTAKGTLFGCLWKLKYGRKIRIGFPQGLEKVRMEKDKEAERSEEHTSELQSPS